MAVSSELEVHMFLSGAVPLQEWHVVLLALLLELRAAQNAKLVKLVLQSVGLCGLL